MQQDSNSSFEVTTAQQQYQVPLQTNQQQGYGQSNNNYSSQPQYPPQNIKVQGSPYPGQQELVVVNTQMGNATQSQLLCNQSRFPVPLTCPYCQRQGATKIDYQTGSGTWCCCFILALFICCICWVPFLGEKCKDATHSCPHCGQVVGMCPYKVCG
ncbi:unnamed protein product (macronuclear) [Paramecium tetraurelia]|uniref:LITAF domain-containing protein n=1 Tax=Paramecium tetraurelia TaxID=5888 RepID=A0DDV9_PARTE|nr:uncharacterized protein GSPATT00016067001 [Paramecium tetraurelia]CAK81226.1 unnamed protein product [Paramecium tetraurelia]|eukprot:XP_001448623.1 hypothetical protein (macronuclear) [Paramecium tetraurelia strain d4-2]